MVKSSKTTSQQKSESQTRQTNKQSTAKPSMSLSCVSPSTQQTELLKKIQAKLEQICSGDAEEIKEFLQFHDLESLPEEQLLKILTDLDNFSAVQNLFTLYQDVSDMLQDYQTLVEDFVAQLKEAFNEGVANEGYLANRYYKKMIVLHLNIFYSDKLLQYACKFAGYTSKHKLNLQQIQLYHDLPIMFANDRFDQHCQDTHKESQQFIESRLEMFFDIIQAIVDSTKEELTPASYRSFLKEVQDCVSNFALQKAQFILELNNKYVKLATKPDYFNVLLFFLIDDGIEDPSDGLAFPFEYLLSDDVFHTLPRLEETTLIFPDILKIQLKYSPLMLQQWYAIIFHQNCRWYGLTPEDFVAKMKEIRDKRLKEARPKRTKRATTTVPILKKRIRSK